MKEKYKKFIEDNLQKLNMAVDSLGKATQMQTWNEFELAGIGSYLSNIYNSYESILKTLLEDRGIKIDKGEQWHRDLLNKAEEEGLIPNISDTLDKMLSFRHMQRYSFSFELIEDTIKKAALEVIKSHPIFEKHIQDLLV